MLNKKPGWPEQQRIQSGIDWSTTSPPSYKKPIKKAKKLTEVLIRERLRSMNPEVAMKVKEIAWLYN